jgi:hypothetical protein
MAYFLSRVDAGSLASETQDYETAKIATTSFYKYYQEILKQQQDK